MYNKLLIRIMYILTSIFISQVLLFAEDAVVTIIGHRQEPANLDDDGLILLDGVNKGEFLEIIIEGTIYDFEHMKIDFTTSGNDLIFSDTPIHSLGDLSDQRVVIKTYLPEGIPSEKIKWKGVDGKVYEYIFNENGMGPNEWIYNVQSLDVTVGGIAGFWDSLDQNYSKDEVDKKFNLPIFSPIGWSKDGKIAYFEKYEVQRRGGFIINFSIVDAVTDQIVFTKKYDSFKLNGDLIDYVTKSDLPFIQSVLNSYNIIIQDDFSLLTFPFRLKDLEYDMSIENTLKKSRVFSDIDVLSQLKINVLRSDGKWKTILNKNYNSRSGKEQTEVIVLGIMKSPYEERMIILYTFDYYSPDLGATLYTRITGSHLTAGFK